ncbi:MAG: hypothetical protein ACK5K7_06115 [Bacilli bacterium]
MSISKDTTLEELKSFADENKIEYDENITKENLYSLLESELKIINCDGSENEDAFDEIVSEKKPSDVNASVETPLQDNKKKKGLIIGIIVGGIFLTAVIIAAVLFIVINTKTYDIEKRTETKNSREFYELIETFNSTYETVENGDNIDVSVDLPLEEQRTKFQELYSRGDELSKEVTDITVYISECEKDFKITDDELNDLENMIADFNEKWGE